MANKIFKYIVTAMDYSKRAVMGFKLTSNKPFIANTAAITLFGDEKGRIDIKKIFSAQEITDYWREMTEQQLKKDGAVLLYDLSVMTHNNVIKIADVQLGYADPEHSIMFAEFFFKEDTRMEQAISQVNLACRAEGILDFDTNLSVVHCNRLFQEVFDADPDNKDFLKYFSNGFQPTMKEKLLLDIHKTLNETPTLFTKMKVFTTKGEERWYSLELQRRTLDDSGRDKLMAYLVNIESQVEIEEQLDDTSRYFSVLQAMWGGKLYRFDIKNRILHRTVEYAKSYDLPCVSQHYPDVDYLKNVIHPDDLQEYLDFIEEVVAGKEGSIDSRTRTKDGDYEYHNMTFKALMERDGNISEMIGFAQNVDAMRQTEEKLGIVNQYFSAIQALSEDMLYRVDLETKTLFRTSEQAEFFGISAIMPNYPHSILSSGIVHPDDEENYLKYGSDLLKGVAGKVEVRLKSSDGNYGYRRLTCTPVYGEKGELKEMFGKIVNIQSVRELEEQANYDALTKLLNKRAMLEFTSNALMDATKRDRHALFFMDLDDFKYVNDNLGHAFGDFLLAELGKRLRDCVRSQDFVGRVGGDEFVIFLRDVPTTDIVMGKAKMLLSTISEDFSDNDIHHTMHGSLGIALFPEHGSSYEELYHHADLALYSSKRKGKNTVTLYDESMNQN